MKEVGTLFRLLGDEVRLRLLRLLVKERLNVSELTSVLGIAQSGVSRHIGLLRDAGLVTEEREGGFTFLRAVPDENDSSLGPVWALLQSRFADVRGSAVVRGDESRLREVMYLRCENVADHGLSSGPRARQLVPGRSWIAWSRGIGLLLPALTVADLGCGEGFLTIEVARWAKRVIGVDRSANVLGRARALAERKQVENIEWRLGEIEKIPLDPSTVEVALLSQALHHAHDPQRALIEAVRVVVAGGRGLVLDLKAHKQDWARDRLGDRWLGFSAGMITAMMGRAGLVDLVVRSADDDVDREPFCVQAVVGTKPLRESHGNRKSKGRGQR